MQTINLSHLHGLYAPLNLFDLFINILGYTLQVLFCSVLFFDFFAGLLEGPSLLIYLEFCLNIILLSFFFLLYTHFILHVGWIPIY